MAFPVPRHPSTAGPSIIPRRGQEKRARPPPSAASAVPETLWGLRLVGSVVKKFKKIKKDRVPCVVKGDAREKISQGRNVQSCTQKANLEQPAGVEGIKVAAWQTKAATGTMVRKSRFERVCQALGRDSWIGRWIWGEASGLKSPPHRRFGGCVWPPRSHCQRHTLTRPWHRVAESKKRAGEGGEPEAKRTKAGDGSAVVRTRPLVPPFSLDAWIAEHKHLLKPPVGAKMIWV